MIIANPIYDVTFKRILENDRAAKFLIGTILDCEVISLVPNIQERTYEKNETREIALFRMDFSATIKTKDDGEKKVLIEVQKALHDGDIDRFRGYLGSEYLNSNLPIITIYILGFNLLVDSPAFVARPECWDLRTNEKIDVKETFIQQVIHSAYFVQTLKIKPNYNTRLDKLLSIFEQANFIGQSQTTKAFNMPEIEPDLNEIVKILEYVAADDEMKKVLNSEEYYHKEMERMFGKSHRMLIEQERMLIERESLLIEKDNTIEEQESIIEEKVSIIEEKDKKINNIISKLKDRGLSEEEISSIIGTN